MRTHITSAAYGVVDYAAYPIGMLFVSPIVLHHIGIAEYGIWAVATAVVSTGGIIASGFGDANIQHVARLRGTGDKSGLQNAVRCIVGINLALGTVMALVGWLLSPQASRHIAASNATLQQSCLVSLRIASVLILVRALDSVCISTQRAFERYGAATRISVGVRMLTLALAGLLAYTGRGTVYIMEVTAAVFVVGTVAQFYRLYQLLGDISFLPAFNGDTAKAILVFGVFSWMQAVAGVVFGQVDRLLMGVSLGAVAVAAYALCIQLSQPIFGLTASALHFIFPYLSGRVDTISAKDFKRVVAVALAANVLFVSAGAVLLLLFGTRLLRVWAGEAIAREAAPIFSLVVIGSALLGLSVTGTYVMLALGRVRAVTWFGVAGGTAMLLMMWRLLPIGGMRGLAIARLCYGSFSLLLYLPLVRILAANEWTATPAIVAIREYEEATEV
jgi:O-antigen/teichoic acid export membrane protein